MNDTHLKIEEEETVDIKQILNKYLKHLKWFVFSVFVFVVAAFVYLRYATPLYNTSATLLIKDEKKGGLATELSNFTDIGVFGANVGNVDNEIEILKSRALVEKTIKHLDLQISYFVTGRLKSTEAYKNSPVVLTRIDNNEAFFKLDTLFYITSITEKEFVLTNSNKKNGVTYAFGQTIETPSGNFVVKPTPHFNKKDYNDVKIVIKPLESVVNKFVSGLNVTSSSKTTSIINLSIVNSISEIGEDFINTHIVNYNNETIVDKNIVAQNTENFINGRLDIIYKELDSVERGYESFKKANGVTDIVSEAGLYMKSSSEYEQKYLDNEIQFKVVEDFSKFMQKSAIDELLPSNILPSDNNAGSLINQYNQLVLEYRRIAEGASEDNPSLINRKNEMLSLRKSIFESINNLKKSLSISKRNLALQENQLTNKLGEIPRQERESRAIGRNQMVKETLYLYLLQKREENAIALNVTAPNSKIVDAAYTNPVPVSPKKSIIYLGSIIIGLLIPFLIIYIKDLLDTKVKNRLDIEGKIQIPFIGDIPKSDSYTELIKATSRSSAAEALRIVRTNLDFMINGVEDGVAKTIFITSTLPNEGKTMISTNLAAVFALSGKKVLMVGLDIRNPELDRFIDVPSIGLTNYLSSKETDLESLIVKQPGYENFDVLPAGVIPPNPAELLLNNKVDEMFDKLKQNYDYIIVDTAPVGLVTDTLLVAKHAHLFIYVVRANVLDKSMLKVPENLYKEKKLPNMGILLNDTDIQKGYGYGYAYGYGYGYGYGATETKKPWWKRFLRK